MAHTKALGSTKLGRDSISKRLGVKVNHGAKIMVGQIIVRQRGTKYHPGANVMRAGDDTLYAMKNGIVQYSEKTLSKFNGSRKKSTVVAVKA